MKVLMPIPEMDFDPTEVAVTWRSLKDRGIEVVFATPTGGEAEADHLMLTGEGLDPWGAIPLFRKLRLLGLFLRADRPARIAYGELEGDPSFQDPLMFTEMRTDDFDGLVLPGGHRARGMQEYLESNTLRKFVGAFFATGKPVGAICHGVVLAARSRSPLNGKSVLYGRKTTALTWAMERSAWNLTRFFGRFWDPGYYRTYVETRGQPKGSKSVEHEVKAFLERPSDFVDVTGDFKQRFRKSSGFYRDSGGRDWAAHVVVDDNYVSARWPGDAYTFAARFGDVLLESRERRATLAATSRYIDDSAVEPAYDPFAKTQILSRMPKGVPTAEDLNHTIIIASPRKPAAPKIPEAVAESGPAGVISEPVAKLDAAAVVPEPAVKIDAAATPEPAARVKPAEAAPQPEHVKTVALAQPPDLPEARAVPLAAEAAVAAPADEFARTQVMAVALAQEAPSADTFANTLALSEPPMQENPAAEAFATTQVLAEPPAQEAGIAFAKTQVLPEPPVQAHAPADDFEKTQVLSAPPIQAQAPADDFATTQVLSEPLVQAQAPADDFATTQVLSQPPLQSQHGTDAFAKTQVLSEPALQSEAVADAFAKTQVMSEPPIQVAPAGEAVAASATVAQPPMATVPVDDFEKTQMLKPVPARQTAPPDDFEKTQVLSRAPEQSGHFMTSAVDDFDRTLIVKRPSAEELEQGKILARSGK